MDRSSRLTGAPLGLLLVALVLLLPGTVALSPASPRVAAPALPALIPHHGIRPILRSILPSGIVISTVDYSSSVDSFPLSYSEVLPAGFVPSDSYPLLVELHGIAVTNSVPKDGGYPTPLDNLTMNDTSAMGFILIVPNTRTGDGFYIDSTYTGPQAQDIQDAITTEKELRQIGSVYLYGFSMGSMGTLSIGLQHPTEFAGLGSVATFSDIYELYDYQAAHDSVPLNDALLNLTGGLLPNASAYAVQIFNELTELRAEDGRQAAQLAIQAGVNIELPDPDCYTHVVELVRKGRLKESRIDELVAPMLAWKFRLGLFEDPYVDPEIAERIVGCEAHRELALQAARETITLLKNDGGLAPLDPRKIRTIAVIGPNADRRMLGGYSGVPKHHTTVLQGIRDRVGPSVSVLYHEGCKITIGGAWQQDEVMPSDPNEDRKSIAEAVKVAQQADVVVLAIGENEQTSREAWALNHLGDRASLDLVGLQDQLVDAIAATGKPIVAVLFNGRPISIRNLAAKASAIFECWYLGQETGRVFAEALFGDINPGGKLPITIPRSVGHVPAYYNYKPAARRGYLFDDVTPLYAFGFGLSYTQFHFEKPRLKKSTIGRNESTAVLIDVKNTGPRAGDEVVEMYIRDKVSSVTRPVKELKGFERVTLAPGETKTIALEIAPEHLAFYNIEMEYLVEPGLFEIMVGNSSRDQDLQKVMLRVK